MLSIGDFVRKTFKVRAVQVTVDNIDEVAKWCEGEVRETSNGTRFIKIIPKKQQRHQNQLDTAFPGFWVLQTKDMFRIYKDNSFPNSFEPIKSQEEKRDEVLQLVISAMMKQDTATYFGNSSEASGYADVVTDKLMEIL